MLIYNRDGPPQLNAIPVIIREMQELSYSIVHRPITLEFIDTTNSIIYMSATHQRGPGCSTIQEFICLNKILNKQI
jgi:hypothetical protein